MERKYLSFLLKLLLPLMLFMQSGPSHAFGGILDGIREGAENVEREGRKGLGNIEREGRKGLGNIEREGRRGAEQAAPFVTAPMGAINHCMHDLRTCPDSALNLVPLANLVEICLRDLTKCPDRVIKSAPGHLAWPVIGQYKQGLMNQAHRKWHALPEFFVSEFAHRYPQIDMRRIRYASGINTTHGQAITIGYTIFYPNDMNYQTRFGLKLMLHEIEHVLQYELKGGEQSFIGEYLLRGAVQIIRCRCLDVHDSIDTESAAIRKANYLIADYGYNFEVKNQCNRDVLLAIYYKHSSGEWKMKQYSFAAGETSFLGDSKAYLHSTNRIFYYYAATKDGSLEWVGDDKRRMWEVDGEAKTFREVNADAESQFFNVTLQC